MRILVVEDDRKVASFIHDGLAQEGAAIILSSHLLSLVEEVCTHLLVLKGGRKLVDGGLTAGYVKMTEF